MKIESVLGEQDSFCAWKFVIAAKLRQISLAMIPVYIKLFRRQLVR